MTERQALLAAIGHVAIPSHQPPVSDVVAGADDRIWLRREAVSAPWTWTVLTARGDVAANCTAPPGVRLLAAGARTASGVREDELGVPYLIRLEIRDR